MILNKINISHISVFILLFVSTVQSQNNVKEPLYIRLLEENDLFIPRNSTDRYFTNGTKLEILSNSFCKIPTKHILVSLNGPKIDKIFTVSLGQNMYTPTNINSPYIQQNNRPYAAWLYISHGLISIDSLNKQKIISELDIGVIGKIAIGKEIQTFIHVLFGFHKPKGWDNQIKNDVGINYYVNYEKGIIAQKVFETIISINSNFGTVFNNIGFGSVIRFGKFNNYFDNISGTVEIQKNIGGSNDSIVHLSNNVQENKNENKFELYVFIKPNLRFVLDNSLLQGGIFNRNNPYTITNDDISRIYLNAEFGLAIRFCNFSLIYSQFFRTAEFKGSSNHQWGGLTLLFKFN